MTATVPGSGRTRPAPCGRSASVGTTRSGTRGRRRWPDRRIANPLLASSVLVMGHGSPGGPGRAEPDRATSDRISVQPHEGHPHPVAVMAAGGITPRGAVSGRLAYAAVAHAPARASGRLRPGPRPPVLGRSGRRARRGPAQLPKPPPAAIFDWGCAQTPPPPPSPTVGTGLLRSKVGARGARLCVLWGLGLGGHCWGCLGVRCGRGFRQAPQRGGSPVTGG
jgi:hypothetical protein